MRAELVALLLAGCVSRSLGPGNPDNLVDAGADLATVDFAVADSSVAIDLGPDLSGIDLGPKLHLGDPCEFDEQCLSGDCVTPSESRDEFDNVCGQACATNEPSCVEGLCLTFDTELYWCLLPCVAENHNAECKDGFVCCEAGAVEACVAPTALVCEPL